MDRRSRLPSQACASAEAIVGLAASRLIEGMISDGDRVSALATCKKPVVRVKRTHGGCFIPATGAHVQSVVSPPILRIGR